MRRILLITGFILSLSVFSQAQSHVGGTDPVLHFYPNPATSAISFDLQKGSGKGYSLVIFSFLGRKMLEQPNLSDHNTINLNDFSRGVYVYQLRDNTGRIVETGKFQVSK